jgi:hypothetical protein
VPGGAGFFCFMGGVMLDPFRVRGLGVLGVRGYSLRSNPRLQMLEAFGLGWGESATRLGACGVGCG